MADANLSDDIESLVKNNQELTKTRDELEKNKLEVSAELQTRRKALKRMMDECKDLGFDPNNIKEELGRQIEVERVKQEALASELETASSMIKPMIEEIKKG